eukprot:TRINITY_DN7460_c0_g1_i1.p1 TRINITY_DN7460_c0_g1~~TRINITY_DN7460_c0_g1_i1.p1  ORF type:complete len:158 (+),score=59.78 TRINITY_DN7460_c0_g1_i1:50-475(+)
MKVVTILTVLVCLLHAVCGVNDEFQQVLQNAAAMARVAPPEQRAKLQDMLTAHAKEHGLDLRQILTPSQYKDIFGDKDAAEEVEEEEEEDVDTEAEEWKDKIREFIKTHKPSMSEKKVNALFSRYAGKEEQLYDDLVTKYA